MPYWERDSILDGVSLELLCAESMYQLSKGGKRLVKAIVRQGRK